MRVDDIFLGAQDAPITIVEYASMTCPHCANFDTEVMPELRKNYIETGKVKFVFREFPLDGAARVASAVARCLPSDHYFSFIDLLFRNQKSWIKDFDNNGQITKSDILEGLSDMGAKVGMSRQEVEGCADDLNNLAIVDANAIAARDKYHVDSTPTFFINGTVYVGEISYGDLRTTLDKLLAKR